jgi:hypothetical protein
MNKIQLKETIREIITKVLNENAPAPSKPSTSPGPAVAPGKPGEKPKPRRPLGNPDVKPKPKASMNEDEMLNKIVARFKSKKLNELSGNPYIKAIETDKPIFRYINGKAARITKDDLKKLYSTFSDNHGTLQSFAEKTGVAIEYAKDIVTAGQYYTEQDKKAKNNG